MSQPIKTVNMFGPIGGTDYLKQTLANKFKSKLKGNPMLTAMSTNPIPGQAQPQQVSKNAGQMHPRFSSNGGVASLSATGTMRIPNIDSDRQVLKAAMEKLISGGTYDDELVDKTAVAPLALKLLPAAWQVAKGAPGLVRGAFSAIRGGTGAAKAFNTAETVGGGISGAAKSMGAAVRAGASKQSPEAAKLLSRAGERLGGPATNTFNRGWGAVQGYGMGYGFDTGADILGYDTDGWGAMIGGGGGLIGKGPLRLARKGMLGSAGAYKPPVPQAPSVNTMLGARPKPALPPTFRQKLVGTADNLNKGLASAGNWSKGKLYTLAALGEVGHIQQKNTGGMFNMTDTYGNVERANQAGMNGLARVLGYEHYPAMKKDIYPVVQDLRQLLRDGSSNPF